jgi:hypothetical protein
MVPFTIFQRLSSLGSGGGVNAGTFPPEFGWHTIVTVLWLRSQRNAECHESGWKARLHSAGRRRKTHDWMHSGSKAIKEVCSNDRR